MFFVYNQAIRWKNQNIKKESTHKIILKFNKKKRNIARCRWENVLGLRNRMAGIKSFSMLQHPSDRMFFTHLIAMPFTYREIFMFINFISTLEQRRNSSERKMLCSPWWLACFYCFQFLDVLFFKLQRSSWDVRLAGRVSNNNGDAVNLIRREDD